jgi:hypothetical protein
MPKGIITALNRQHMDLFRANYFYDDSVTSPTGILLVSGAFSFCFQNLDVCETGSGQYNLCLDSVVICTVEF